VALPIQRKCWPQRRRSTCSLSAYRGAVLLFHGFGACPDAMAQLAPRLQNECYDVYVPLVVGHGMACSGAATGADCPDGLADLSLLPTRRQAYLDFVDQMVAIMAEEKVFALRTQLGAPKYDNSTYVMAAAGHDLGAALATVAVAARKTGFQKLLMFMPLFGIASGPTDPDVANCARGMLTEFRCAQLWLQGTTFPGLSASAPADALARIASSLLASQPGSTSSYMALENSMQAAFGDVAEGRVTLSQPLQVDLALNYTFGPVCTLSRDTRGRAGYCTVRLRHALGAHSLGVYAMHAARNVDKGVGVQVIMTAADGPNANRMAFQAARGAMRSGATASACVFYPASRCSAAPYSNNCVAPHSAMSDLESAVAEPFVMYWNATITSDAVLWLEGKVGAVGVVAGSTAADTKWDGTRGMCMPQSVVAPDEILAGTTREYVAFTVTALPSGQRATALAALKASIASLTGVSPARAADMVVVDSSVAPDMLPVGNGTSSAPVKRLQALQQSAASTKEVVLMAVPAEVAQAMRLLQKSGAFWTASIANGAPSVSQVQTDRDDAWAVRTAAPTAAAPAKSRTVAAWVFGLVVGLLILLIILMIVLMCLRLRYLQDPAFSQKRTYQPHHATEMAGIAPQQANANQNANLRGPPPPSGPSGVGYSVGYGAPMIPQDSPRSHPGFTQAGRPPIPNQPPR
jgi:pimeloyl-ACP methyl ester carboxylesterase